MNKHIRFETETFNDLQFNEHRGAFIKVLEDMIESGSELVVYDFGEVSTYISDRNHLHTFLEFFKPKDRG